MLNPISILAAGTGDAMIGCVLIACATGALVGLVLWSRKRINQICDSGPRSARLILHDLKNGTLGKPADPEADDE
ncbi:MAG: hypothetical protein HN370_03300 [Phycisphaerales bacterium]|jgi:hypothetical protein|nr:hypothetical protein [Phycisphaerales bacterium]